VRQGSLLPQLARLHREGLGDLASLLESQNRSHTFAHHLTRLSEREHAAVIRELEDLAATAAEPDRRQRLEQAAGRCRNLDRTLALLIDERRQQWHRNGDATRAMMDGFNRTLEELNATLIDKDLLERHSEVLEQVILSYERLSHWQEFVAEILGQFRALFPFQFFFIAFAEEHALSLHLYHAANASPEVAAYARERFSREMLHHLGLPEDAAVDVDEHWVGQAEEEGPAVSREEVDMITVGVPQHTERLDGVVGVAFGSDQALSPQEESTIRSILSVMVMVVGSSKVLSRTLEELEYYAVREPLTGLYNRRHFNEVLEKEMERARRHGHAFTVLLLDVDNFKDINDTFGHPAGDRALQDLARTIQSQTRGDDVVARIGGDEFALILPETDGDGGRVLAETLRDTIREMAFPASGGAGFHVTVSAGVVAYPEDADTFTGVMVQVDEALYRAKERGKDESCIPGREPGSGVRTQRLHAERFREALRENRIRPFYHALLDARTGEPTGYEVLARMVEPDGETLPAGRFIEAIERYGLSRDLDRSILEQSLRMAAEAPEAPPRLFLNLSAQEIQHRGILGYAEELCDRLGIPPARVVFEILEREAIEDLSGMRRFLDELRSKGFAFALDDFGSGYNSFHYLRELRFEYVKIDGAFVRNVLRSRVDYVLVENLVRMCRDLGMATIAEFVESEEVMEAVCAMGVDYLQGFHISLPTPAPVWPPMPAAFA